jgi:hypothetical protein
MSSQQLQEKFELIAKYLFTYFERTNFQTNTPRVRKKRIVYIKCFFVFFLKNVVDTLSLAGHHNKREFSIDFYYNPGQHGRSVNGSKLIKNGGFTEPRYFSYTDIRPRYRYGYITDRFTGPFTCYRLRSANERRLRTVLRRFS